MYLNLPVKSPGLLWVSVIEIYLCLFQCKAWMQVLLEAVLSNSLLGMVLCLATLTVIHLPWVTFRCQST